MRPAYHTDPHLTLHTGDTLDVLGELPEPPPIPALPPLRHEALHRTRDLATARCDRDTSLRSQPRQRLDHPHRGQHHRPVSSSTLDVRWTSL